VALLNLKISTPAQEAQPIFTRSPIVRSWCTGEPADLWVEKPCSFAAADHAVVALADLSLPLNLEETYCAACTARRIELP